jgi:hypothetical protein
MIKQTPNSTETGMLDSSDQPADERLFKNDTAFFDVVVVGAGPAGICAAVAAARGGAKTALITDRPVLGGSASSEIRVTPCGAAEQRPWNLFARETGIIEEINLLVADKTERSGIWRWVFYDEAYFDLVTAEPNLSIFLNTSILKVETNGNSRICSVTGVQLRAEKITCFQGSMFIDCSGDGTIGYLAGADYRMGREAKSEFNEIHAPEKSDMGTMGATMLFSSIDRGHPVPFKAPKWAIDVRELPTLLDPERRITRRFYRCFEGHFYGVWWAEYGGIVNSINDDGDVVWHTRRLVYGLWDYIKNSGKFPNVERQELDWIGYLPGKRESRRLMGPVICTGNDFREQRNFPDKIGYAGWRVDIHPPKGYLDDAASCTKDFLPGITDIPFGCLFSRNISNLLFAGRDISCSHEGLGPVRVIATTAVCGQAVGEAAAMCIEKEVSPAEIRDQHIHDLQHRLARKDQSIIRYLLREDNDLSRTSTVTASSERESMIEKAEQWFPLDERLGMVLPVGEDSIRSIGFYLRAWRPADVTIRVFSTDKPQNYRLGKLVCTINRTVRDEEWVFVEQEMHPGPGEKLIFVFETNPQVMVGYANTRATGILSFRLPGTDPLDENTDYEWNTFTPCFKTKPELPLFNAENVIDGHPRPFGLPHCWSSKQLDPSMPEWITLRFRKESVVTQAEVVFNTDLNAPRHSIKGIYPELVRDYDLFVITDEGLVRVVNVRDNIRRFNVHRFNAVSAKGIQLKVYATWGAPFAELFDLRVYGEPG